MTHPSPTVKTNLISPFLVLVIVIVID